MDDISLEYRVERQKRVTDRLIKFGSVIAAVLFGVMSLTVNSLLFLPAIACLVVFFVLVPRLNVEYEYLFVAGELTIDMIFDKKSRKNAANYDISDVELIAPEGNEKLSAYAGSNCKKTDFSSGREGAERYVIISRKGGETVYAIIESGEDILKAIYNRYPNKFAVRLANS